ncbi:MAG TPA: hypothetical protein PLS25_07210, partial [Methanoregulaceae archaeon]|nr:hypothetical protein [Methanoregulaceae archaeon]
MHGGLVVKLAQAPDEHVPVELTPAAHEQGLVPDQTHDLLGPQVHVPAESGAVLVVSAAEDLALLGIDHRHDGQVGRHGGMGQGVQRRHAHEAASQGLGQALGRG